MAEPTFTATIPISLTVAGQTRAFDVTVPASAIVTTSQSQPASPVANYIEERDLPNVIPLPWGRIEIATNEVSLISTVDDPPKFRLAAASGGSLGAISGNRLRSDGVQEELVLIQMKQDERTRADPHHYSGEFTIHVRNGFVPGDAGMIKVAELRHDGVWFRRVETMPDAPPVIVPQPPSPPVTPPVQPPADTNTAKLDHLRALELRYTPIKFDETDIAGYLNGDSDAAYMEDLMKRKNDGNAR